jgi:hypothetical protein
LNDKNPLGYLNEKSLIPCGMRLSFFCDPDERDFELFGGGFLD